MTQPLSTPREVSLDVYDMRFAMVRDRLVAICRGLVGADAAEDVVHDTFLRGRRAFHQLRDEELFEAWITRIAVRVCLDLRRANRRFTEVVRAWWRSERHEPQRDVGLRELIERLPPRERTLVVLHYGYGYEKGHEIYSAHAETVGPLPYRDMPAYPPPDGSQGPEDLQYLDYLLEWNTRPAFITGPATEN